MFLITSFYLFQITEYEHPNLNPHRMEFAEDILFKTQIFRIITIGCYFYYSLNFVIHATLP